MDRLGRVEYVSAEVEDDSQNSEVLSVIPVHLEDAYDPVGLSSQNSSVSKGKYYKQTYRPAWEQMPDFHGWLRGVAGEPTRAYCIYCQKTLHAHRLSLLKHTCTIRHQKAAQVHNSKKNKSQSQMETEEIHTVILQDDDQSQEEGENEEGDTIEYAEIASEVEDDNQNKMEENTHQIQTIHLTTKHTPRQQTYANFNNNSPISTHVIDSTKGTPVIGLQVSLYKLIDGRWTYINEGITNNKGRFANFVESSDFSSGRYKLHYDVDRYFEVHKQDTVYPFIEVVFDIKSETDSYHLPLLLSPFGYTTYKGT